MPLPWKKSKSGRISRFVSDFQQSPKHGGSLVVETGFPTSLIDLFVKNRDRLKKQSSKRNKTPPITRRRVSPPPSPPPPPSVAAALHRGRSLPINLDDPSTVMDVPVKIEESGLKTEKKHEDDGGRNGGGGCVLMVVAFKVFVVAVLALSTKRLAVGITLSAFSLIFLEFAVARVFTLLNLCPHAEVRLGSFLGKRKQEEETIPERKNRVTFEIYEESRDCNEEIQDSRIKNQESSLALEIPKPVEEEETIRDVVFKKEKSKSAKLKSKIVKKIVPKKLRSYKKKKKSKEEEIEIIEIIGEEEYGGGEEEEEGSSMTEVSSYYSDDRMVESEVSERDEVSSYQPYLESCCEEIVEEEEEIGGNGNLKKVMVLIVIVLAGLLHGKVVAIGLTLSSCLILKLVCNNKSQTSL